LSLSQYRFPESWAAINGLCSKEPKLTTAENALAIRLTAGQKGIIKK